jgi:hypothetical protein
MARRAVPCITLAALSVGEGAVTGVAFPALIPSQQPPPNVVGTNPAAFVPIYVDNLSSGVPETA